MGRLTALLIPVLLFVLVVTACGGDGEGGQEPDGDEDQRPNGEASVVYWALQTCELVGRSFASLPAIGSTGGPVDGQAFVEHRDLTSQRAAIIAGSHEGLVLGLEAFDRPTFVADFHETLTDEFSRLRDAIERAAGEFREAESQLDIDRIRNEVLSVEEELIRVARTEAQSLSAEAFAELQSRSGCDPITTG